MNKRSSDSALRYFISKITSQEPKILYKNKFYHFWWLAPENSKNHFFQQKLVKNLILSNRIKIKYWFGVFMWLNKQNSKRISTYINKTYCRCHKVLISAKQAMICCLITIFCFFMKNTLQDLPLDRSAPFLSLVVQDFWNFVRKHQFHHQHYQLKIACISKNNNPLTMF